jgi:DNA-binding transcriptional LysR family regulator
MDIRSLRYAITLAEELHFGRAAQRHYISAQPFGRHIQNLERELGVRLFERTSRRVTVTSAGARVVAEARAIVDAVDALTDSRRWAEPDEEGLTIGVLGAATGRPSLFAAATSRRVPRPDMRLVSLDLSPTRLAMATRDDDDRSSVASFRRAAQLFTTRQPLRLAVG